MQYSMICMNRLSIHFPSDGQLGCVCLFAITNSALMNIYAHVFLHISTCFSRAYIQNDHFWLQVCTYSTPWNVQIALQNDSNNLYSIPYSCNSFQKKEISLNQVPKEKGLGRTGQSESPYNLLKKRGSSAIGKDLLKLFRKACDGSLSEG